jgi:hypothetical protein
VLDPARFDVVLAGPDALRRHARDRRTRRRLRSRLRLRWVLRQAALPLFEHAAHLGHQIVLRAVAGRRRGRLARRSGRGTAALGRSRSLPLTLHQRLEDRWQHQDRDRDQDREGLRQRLEELL